MTPFDTLYLELFLKIAKNRKSALKYLFLHLRYGQEKYAVPFNTTRGRFVPNPSQIQAVSVVLFPKMFVQLISMVQLLLNFQKR